MEYVIYAMGAVGMFGSAYSGEWPGKVGVVSKMLFSTAVAIFWPAVFVWIVADHTDK